MDENRPINPKQGRNPANRQSDLFKSLTRLFSGPIVSFRTQSGKRIRRQHLDKFSTRFKTASGQQFKKTTYNPLDTIAINAINNQRRSERYVDFDQMEYMPEIASSLDIYADEMTTYSELRPMLTIKCPNEEIKAMLDILYNNVLNVQHNLFGWCRTLAKYGDYMLYLDIDENVGVQSAISLPIQEVERLEGLDATNPNYIQYQWNSAGLTFENWQVAHFRILGNDKYAPYGTSVLEPVRRIWRQLTLMEDAMMSYRIVRSSERRVFKIDVGGVPPNEVEQYMEKIVTQLKRHSVIDPDTGRVDLRYNPMSIEEDYFIPVRPGSTTDIVSLAGAQNIAAIDDIKYLRDKMFSGLKIPQSYLTMGEGATEDKTTLAQKDIRFARTIQRLQRVIISELEKIGVIHLHTLGFKGEDLLSFSLTLNNPSKIAELQELEHWKQKFDVAGSATEGYFSRRWVAENLFGMSMEEFIRNQREMYYDRKHDANLQAVVESAASNEAGDSLGGDLGGLDLGADTGGGGEGLDLGGGEAAGGGEAGGGGEAPEAGTNENPLLAAPPGSRRSPRITPGSKGRIYYPRKFDSRSRGARSRSFSAIGKTEIGTQRSTLPGYIDGLRTLGRGVVEENEEQALFERTSMVNEIVESIEKANNKELLKERLEIAK